MLRFEIISSFENCSNSKTILNNLRFELKMPEKQKIIVIKKKPNSGETNIIVSQKYRQIEKIINRK